MMTIEQISFRDFVRGAIPSDIVKLLDKRTHKSKGIFVSTKYADDVLEFIALKESKRKNAKKKALLDFVGEFGEGSSESHQAIKASKYE
jgi:hypothetical protein